MKLEKIPGIQGATTYRLTAQKLEERPIESSPKEDKDNLSKEYIDWFQEDNNATPLKYANRAIRSPTHRDCINKFVNLTFGQNIKSKDQTFIDSLDDINASGESWLDINKKAAEDFRTYGNEILHIVKSTGNKYEYYHQDAGQWRPHKKINPENGKPIGYWHSGDWEKKSLPQYKPVFYPSFPDFRSVENQRNRHSIVHFKTYTPMKFYLGLPDWIASKDAIDTEMLIFKYNLDGLRNGFLADYIITIPTQVEEGDTVTGPLIKKKIQEDFIGVDNDNSKKPMVEIVDPISEKGITVTKIERDTDGDFGPLGEIIANTIIKSHGFTPQLMGVRTAGKLGNATELMIDFEMAKQHVIIPYQIAKLDMWRKVWKATGVKPPKDITMPIEQPFNPFALIDVDKVFTKDEIRAKGFGQPELEESQKQELIRQNGTNNGGTGNREITNSSGN